MTYNTKKIWEAAEILIGYIWIKCWNHKPDVAINNVNEFYLSMYWDTIWSSQKVLHRATHITIIYVNVIFFYSFWHIENVTNMKSILYTHRTDLLTTVSNMI